MIGVLNKYGDVADVGGDGGVVVHHGDGRLLGAHLQESLAGLNTKSNRHGPADARQHVATAVHASGPLWLHSCVSHLVLSLQRQDIGDFAEGQAQGDDLSLGGLVRQLPDVEHPRGRRLLHPQLFTVAAIGGPV